MSTLSKDGKKLSSDDAADPSVSSSAPIALTMQIIVRRDLLDVEH